MTKETQTQGRGFSGPQAQTLWTRCHVREINHHQRWLSQSYCRSGPLLCSLLIKPESGDRNQLHCWYERKRFMRKQVRRLSAVFDDCEELNKDTNGFSSFCDTKETRASLQPCISTSITSGWVVFMMLWVTCTVVETFQDAGTFPYLRITRTRCPLGW